MQTLLPIISREKMYSFLSIFENTNPVHLEIGSGKGVFLVQEAKKNPNINYIGIEIIPKYAKLFETRVKNAKLPNLKVLIHDAFDALTYNFPIDSFEKIYIFFPDPWPKRKHKVRRLLQDSFLELVYLMLKEGGELEIGTDVKEYYEKTPPLLEKYFSNIICKVETEKPKKNARTSFERKYLDEGRVIYNLHCAKKN